MKLLLIVAFVWLSCNCAFSQKPGIFSFDTSLMAQRYSAKEDTVAEWATTDTTYLNGAKDRVHYYNGNGEECMQKIFFPNGKIKEILKMDEYGANKGWLQMWFPNGEKDMEKFFINGLPDGTSYDWDSLGHLILIADCKLGDCTYRDLFPNMNIKHLTKSTWQTGIYFEQWFCEDGMLNASRNEGSHTDPYFLLDCDGDTLIKGATNNHGFFIGDFWRKYSNGNFSEKGAYKVQEERDALKIGKWFYYDEKGHLTKTEFYDGNGKLINSK